MNSAAQRNLANLKEQERLADDMKSLEASRQKAIAEKEELALQIAKFQQRILDLDTQLTVIHRSHRGLDEILRLRKDANNKMKEFQQAPFQIQFLMEAEDAFTGHHYDLVYLKVKQSSHERLLSFDYHINYSIAITFKSFADAFDFEKKANEVGLKAYVYVLPGLPTNLPKVSISLPRYLEFEPDTAIQRREACKKIVAVLISLDIQIDEKIHALIRSRIHSWPSTEEIQQLSQPPKVESSTATAAAPASATTTTTATVTASLATAAGANPLAVATVAAAGVAPEPTNIVNAGKNLTTSIAPPTAPNTDKGQQTIGPRPG